MFKKNLLQKSAATQVANGPQLQRTMSQATSGVCLITFARNEDVFLRHWIWHYSRLLKRPRFLLLDDASNPEMLAGLRAEFPQADLEVIRLPEGPFSDQYKANALSALAMIAVERFAVVIASDADEIVTPLGENRGKPFFETLRSLHRPFAAPIGVLPIHDPSREPAFDPLEMVARQRAVGILRSACCKPSVWQGEGWLFAPGQHGLRQRRTPITDKVAMLHLKYVDAALLAERLRDRNKRTMSVDQRKFEGSHWNDDAETIQEMKIFKRAAEFRNAPEIGDALKSFLTECCDRHNGEYVIRSLRESIPARIGRDL